MLKVMMCQVCSKYALQCLEAKNSGKESALISLNVHSCACDANNHHTQHITEWERWSDGVKLLEITCR